MSCIYRTGRSVQWSLCVCVCVWVKNRYEMRPPNPQTCRHEVQGRSSEEGTKGEPGNPILFIIRVVFGICNVNLLERIKCGCYIKKRKTICTNSSFFKSKITSFLMQDLLLEKFLFYFPFGTINLVILFSRIRSLLSVIFRSI